jgi:hypothetical protein
VALTVKLVLVSTFTAPTSVSSTLDLQAQFF